MTARQEKYLSEFTGKPHSVFYKEWGNAANQDILVCMHGLTRNSGDFDYFCSRMQDTYRIACPDMPGRGQSDWMPKDAYGYPLYATVAAGLIARLGASSLDWLGTSMGGFVGMMLAAQPATPIRKLVLNDVGPVVSRATMQDIGRTSGNDERFASFDEVVAYFKSIYCMWGEIPQAQWRNVAEHSSRKLADGSYALAYDPALIAPLKENPETIQDVSIWPVFEAISIPMLLLHGAESTVLTAETVPEMKRRNKNLEVVEFPGIGHCPSLMVEEQVQLVRNWLRT